MTGVPLSGAGAARVLVIGAGSIGARHVRCLHAGGARVDVMDPDVARAAASAEAGGGAAVAFDLDRLGGYDGIVVASPTTFHAAQARAALTTTDAVVMVEKPLALRADGVEDLVALGKGRGMVGYNLRLHEPVRRTVELVHQGAAGRVLAYRLWFGSWLPGWRPQADYRTTYSARAELGGGVLLDAIHELDLLVWLAGDDDFDVIGAVVAAAGDLEIDVEDTAKALLRLTDGRTAEVSLDYLSRAYRRGIEVVGTDATVRLDWARQVVEVEDAAGVRAEPAHAAVDESYVLQARRFLDVIAGRAEPPVDFALGAASLRLADRIRAAAG
jgi:predicted dehydrogenase